MCQSLTSSRDCLSHLLLGVYGRKEGGLELTPRELDAALQHRPEETGETIRIVNGDIEVNGLLARKSMTQTRAVAVPVVPAGEAQDD